jgi:hypothetical protein
MRPDRDELVTASDRRNATKPETLMLAIGGVVGQIDVVGAPFVFIAQLRERYGAFEMPASKGVTRDFTVTLQMTSAPAPGKRKVRNIETHPLEVTATAREIRMSRWDCDVSVSREGRGRGPFRGQGTCALNPYTFDCVLRVLWSTLLPRVGGLLVHSCGLRHAEIGVVFPGQSGAGKTTLARKAPDADDVLSDELIAIRRTDDGWRVSGTPFWGDFARGGISMRSWPLRTIAFLTQAPRDAVTMTPIVSSEATLRFLSCFLSFVFDAETAARNLKLVIQLCSEVRCVDASLTRKVSTNEIFRKLAPHLGPEIERRVPPANTREMISEFRSFLRKHKSYAFKPQGSSMRPWLKAGDSLFIQAGTESAFSSGDVLLYWRPGAKPDDDRLICHRMVARVPDLAGGASRYVTKGDSLSRFEGFENRRDAEILGKVAAVSRDGKTWPVTGRIGNLARLFGSLVATPLLRMVGR